MELELHPVKGTTAWLSSSSCWRRQTGGYHREPPKPDNPVWSVADESQAAIYQFLLSPIYLGIYWATMETAG